MIAAHYCLPTKWRCRCEIAVAIGVPDRILIGARAFPGHLIAARRLLGADRRPATKLARHNIGATVFQRGVRPGADAVEKKLGPHRHQAGRAGRLDDGPGNAPIAPSPFKSCWKLVSNDCSALLLADIMALSM